MNDVCWRPSAMMTWARALARAMSDRREGPRARWPTARSPSGGVDDHQVRAVPLPLEHVLEHDGMRLPGVRAPEDQDIRLLQLLIGRGPAPGTEHGRQTGDRGGVSGPVAAVDVVRADDGAHELLRGELSSFVVLEHANMPTASGPWADLARAQPPRHGVERDLHVVGGGRRPRGRGASRDRRGPRVTRWPP